MTRKLLICFTASYPYGLKETFFENELPYLASTFDEVIIVPKYNPTGSPIRRKMPDNVVCHEPLVASNKVKRLFQGVFGAGPVGFYFRDFFKNQVYLSRANFARWINSLLTYRRTYKVMKSRMGDFEKSSSILMYSYWAESPLFVPPFFKEYKKVVRMHRGDYYVEENNNYLPVRQDIYNSADLLVPISEHIFQDLMSSYAIEESKIRLCRLGISNSSDTGPNSSSERMTEVIRLVSCSRVDPVKRVGLIADALALYEGDKKIEWHHFGDGTEFDQLKMKTDSLKKETLNIVLHGWATQDDIYEFYESVYVSWLINVSESEGIPVSIMEAMSFGVPVIATDVGGTSEIVNAKTGCLLDKSFNIYTLLNFILSETDNTYLIKRKEAKQMWAQNYKAEVNYGRLSEILRNI